MISAPQTSRPSVLFCGERLEIQTCSSRYCRCMKDIVRCGCWLLASEIHPKVLAHHFAQRFSSKPATQPTRSLAMRLRT